ncbi:hypothetical protein HAX54_010225 [Datura stramonium]|uniref:Uncharacterized protein n=1 Tax=Datura stramonium TaxID=4076 RepID=A0ABS8RYG7_DATST|nr:hypothetical protein [Datura stramonium]
MDRSMKICPWCVRLEFGLSRWLHGYFFLSEFAGSYGGYEVLVVGGFGGAGREEKGECGGLGVFRWWSGVLVGTRREGHGGSTAAVGGF